MKAYKTALVCMVVSAALSGCGKPDNQKPTPDPTPGPGVDPVTDQPYFRLFTTDSQEIPSLIAFDCDGWNQYIPLKVETNLKDWSAESNVTWCQAVPDKSAGIIFLTLDSYYGEPMETLFPRNGEIRIKAGTVFDRTISVSQEANSTYLQTVPENLEPWVLSASGAPMEIRVMTNKVDWEIINDCEWILAEKVDRTLLRVQMMPGNAPRGRTGEITLASIVKTTNPGNTRTLYFKEGDAEMSGEDYDYDNVIDWD